MDVIDVTGGHRTRGGGGPQGAERESDAPDAPDETSGAAGLDVPRPPVSYAEPVAWAEPPTSGFRMDPGERAGELHDRGTR